MHSTVTVPSATLSERLKGSCDLLKLSCLATGVLLFLIGFSELVIGGMVFSYMKVGERHGDIGIAKEFHPGCWWGGLWMMITGALLVVFGVKGTSDNTKMFGWSLVALGVLGIGMLAAGIFMDGIELVWTLIVVDAYQAYPGSYVDCIATWNDDKYFGYDLGDNTEWDCDDFNGSYKSSTVGSVTCCILGFLLSFVASIIGCNALFCSCCRCCKPKKPSQPSSVAYPAYAL